MGHGRQRIYLEDRVQSWEAPHGGNSNNFSHQMSVQQMVLELVQLKI